MPMRTGLETQLACVGFHRRHGDIAFLPEQLSWFQRLVPAIRSVLYALACKEALALSETIAIADLSIEELAKRRLLPLVKRMDGDHPFAVNE